VKTNYVLIDYENVQPAALTILDQEHVKILIFVGANQTKIAIEVASALQRMGARAEYIQISANGPNALDFHIAFYIGQLAAADPGASFHIISKDTGFDPLIQHLKSKKIIVRRSSVVADIPMVKASTAISSDEQIAAIVADLQRRGTAKPRTVKTLSMLLIVNRHFCIASVMSCWITNGLLPPIANVSRIFKHFLSKMRLLIHSISTPYIPLSLRSLHR
jgi:hypothetical protein